MLILDLFCSLDVVVCWCMVFVRACVCACLYVQVGRANLIDYVQTRLEFSDSSSIHL